MNEEFPVLALSPSAQGTEEDHAKKSGQNEKYKLNGVGIEVSHRQ